MNQQPQETPKRIAFIDVQNTESTTNQLLGYVIDWEKAYHYLTTKWNCEKIYFYSGILNGDEAREMYYKKLSELGYILNAKPYWVYKNNDKIIKLNCPDCKNEITHKVDLGVKWKSNCDVEFTVDAINQARENVEYLLFTGDGDFEYLINDVLTKGVKVYILSSAKKIRIGQNHFTSRFSSKLRTLIATKRNKVFFIELDDWKMILKTD